MLSCPASQRCLGPLIVIRSRRRPVLFLVFFLLCYHHIIRVDVFFFFFLTLKYKGLRIDVTYHITTNLSRLLSRFLVQEISYPLKSLLSWDGRSSRLDALLKASTIADNKWVMSTCSRQERREKKSGLHICSHPQCGKYCVYERWNHVLMMQYIYLQVTIV